MTKQKIVKMVSILATVALIGIIAYTYVIRIHNVFDQMYYTRVHKQYEWQNFQGLFDNMEQLEPVGRKLENCYVSEGVFHEIYKKEYLEPSTRLTTSFLPGKYSGKKQVIITYSFADDIYNTDNCKYYQYLYDIDSKTLTYITNDPKDTENRRAFLYNIFLRDWFKANPNTRFSMDNLGKYKEQEMTEEEYQKSISLE